VNFQGIHGNKDACIRLKWGITIIFCSHNILLAEFLQERRRRDLKTTNMMGDSNTITVETKPPCPPFSYEEAVQKVRMAEDAWNSRDPDKVRLDTQYCLRQACGARGGGTKKSRNPHFTDRCLVIVSQLTGQNGVH
jgi:hypothetical protein